MRIVQFETALVLTSDSPGNHEGLATPLDDIIYRTKKHVLILIVSVEVSGQYLGKLVV